MKPGVIYVWSVELAGDFPEGAGGEHLASLAHAWWGAEGWRVGRVYPPTNFKLRRGEPLFFADEAGDPRSPTEIVEATWPRVERPFVVSLLPAGGAAERPSYLASPNVSSEMLHSYMPFGVMWKAGAGRARALSCLVTAFAARTEPDLITDAGDAFDPQGVADRLWAALRRVALLPTAALVDALGEEWVPILLLRLLWTPRVQDGVRDAFLDKILVLLEKKVHVLVALLAQ